MKYIVEITTSNPSHEHVSFRKLQKKTNFVVEAASEAEALNRARGKFRSLGHYVHNVSIVERAQSNDALANELLGFEAAKGEKVKGREKILGTEKKPEQTEPPKPQDNYDMVNREALPSPDDYKPPVPVPQTKKRGTPFKRGLYWDEPKNIKLKEGVVGVASKLVKKIVAKKPVRVQDTSVSNTLGSLKKPEPGENFIAKDRAEIMRSIAADEVKAIRKQTMGDPEARKKALERANYEIVRKEQFDLNERISLGSNVSSAVKAKEKISKDMEDKEDTALARINKSAENTRETDPEYSKRVDAFKAEWLKKKAAADKGETELNIKEGRGDQQLTRRKSRDDNTSTEYTVQVAEPVSPAAVVKRGINDIKGAVGDAAASLKKVIHKGAVGDAAASLKKVIHKLKKQPANAEDELQPVEIKSRKRNIGEETQYIEEKLTGADPASKWISDFVASDNPKFAGKSKKERINMALGAYYSAKRGVKEEIEQLIEGDLSIRTLYNKYAKHYASSEGNSAKRADAVEKAIIKVHGPTVMKHLEKAIKANLRGDMDQEEIHFERARTASEKSGSDRLGATVGRDRAKFKKEEVEQVAEAKRAKLVNVSTVDRDEESDDVVNARNNISADTRAAIAANQRARDAGEERIRREFGDGPLLNRDMIDNTMKKMRDRDQNWIDAQQNKQSELEKMGRGWLQNRMDKVFTPDRTRANLDYLKKQWATLSPAEKEAARKRMNADDAKQFEEVENVNEKLIGNQHKIDANKSGHIDAHDFKLLRDKKKVNQQKSVNEFVVIKTAIKAATKKIDGKIVGGRIMPGSGGAGSIPPKPPVATGAAGEVPKPLPKSEPVAAKSVKDMSANEYKSFYDARATTRRALDQIRRKNSRSSENPYANIKEQKTTMTYEKGGASSDKKPPRGYTTMSYEKGGSTDKEAMEYRAPQKPTPQDDTKTSVDSETRPENKTKQAAEKMVKAMKGKLNKVDTKPEMQADIKDVK